MAESTCIFDIQASWAHNLQQGPQWSGPMPDRRLPREDWVDFLGTPVASRLGVPAGPLLDSRWVAFAGRMGFDVLTYKTLRTQASTGHAPPNVLYLSVDRQLSVADANTALISAGQQLPAPQGSASQQESTAAAVTAAVGSVQPAVVAITNSFGMPSMDRDYLLQDIPAAAAALTPGQVLVVSVTGTPNRADGVSFIDDFVEAALLAKQAGANIIEANLSCPNVGKGQGALYTDPQQVCVLCAALVCALGPSVPLIIKVGAFEQQQQLEAVLMAAAAAGVRGVAGINGLSRTVQNADGSPALGPDRPTSGVCGAPIRYAALEFVRTARDVIDTRQLGLTLIGVGGVVCGQHVLDMLAAGADFVQSATGMMWNPLLAGEYHSLCANKQQQQQQQHVQEQRRELDSQQQQDQQEVSGSAAAAAAAGSPAKQAAAGGHVAGGVLSLAA